jgi:hypothetical protein
VLPHALMEASERMRVSLTEAILGGLVFSYYRSCSLFLLCVGHGVGLLLNFNKHAFVS